MPDYRNPFIFNNPVTPERFIGRWREVGIILDRLVSPACGSTAISGEQDIGKTSLLHYVCSPQVAKKWSLSPEKCARVFIDTRTIVPFTSDGFWRHILRSLVTQQIYDPGRIESLLKDGREKVESFELGDLFDRIAQEGKLVVLLLDGFEHVAKHVSPDNPELLYLLRALINRPMRGLALVLASRDPLNVLLRDIHFSGSPFPTSFTLIPLSPFSPEEANELIDVYTRSTGVTFSDRDKEFAYKISKGHPCWLQKTCSKVFDRHLEKRQRRNENE